MTTYLHATAAAPSDAALPRPEVTGMYSARTDEAGRILIDPADAIVLAAHGIAVDEAQVQGKVTAGASCEDLLVVTPDFLAVVDGATDKSGLRFSYGDAAVSGGRLVAQVVADAISALDRHATARQAVDAISAAVAAELDRQAPDVAVGVRPNASVLLFSVARREVWRIGDSPFRIGEQVWAGGKRIDEVASSMRAAVLRAAMAAGATFEQLSVRDIGREAILPLLSSQGVFANSADPEFGFGVLDGRPVRDSHLTVVPVPAGAEVVLASDGHISLSGTLADAELELAMALAADPLCIGVLQGSKGLAAGQCSFDDRSWLRFTVDA